MKAVSLPKRILIGRPMRTTQLGETLLPKRLALPVFCSDAISSNAYATQEILLVLALGGTSLLLATPWVALAVIALLSIVTISYRQTCFAYPGGGGAYAVSKENLGTGAALVAASALLVDYVMTVAVSIASGVDNLTSAFPMLRPHSVALCLGFIAAITVMNLRGVKESGKAFAVPTYGFIISVYVMLIVGFVRVVAGHGPVAETASYQIAATHRATGALLVLLLLRAFASGCTALTGVEAVSNGVPSFRVPKPHNASATLLMMGALSVFMMGGIALLSTLSRIHIADSADALIGAPAGYAQRTVLAQLSAAVFGNNSAGFYAVQGFTTLILALAANTAFNGFPILASILADDEFLPKQFRRRGDRLVFSNGIIMLAAIAALLIVVFNASVTRLIQLYILGVFISFTLSQLGMVRHWQRELRTGLVADRWRMRRALVVNAIGACATGLVLVIVLATKFTHGAWIVAIAIPVIYFSMTRVRRHYTRVERETAPRASGMLLPSRVHAVVLLGHLNEPALKALAFARAMRPSSLVALRVDTNTERTQRLMEEWTDREIDLPLVIVPSAYRDLTTPVLDYLRSMRIGPRDAVQVFVPEYVVGRWWEHLLHNQSALRLKARLLFMPGVMVTSVPYQLRSAEQYSDARPGSRQPATLEPKPVEPAATSRDRQDALAGR